MYVFNDDSINASRQPRTTRLRRVAQKVWEWLRRITARYPMDALAAAICREFEPRARSNARSRPAIAIQCVEDPFYLGLFAAISQHFSACRDVQVDLVAVRSISGAVGTSLTQRLARSSLIGSILAAQWLRAFAIVGDGLAYRSQTPFDIFSGCIDWLRSRREWQRQRCNPEFAKLTIDGVLVGDLIIDSYLRFRPSPRFDPHDPFVIRLIAQVRRDVSRARAYFRKRRPSCYLTSYSTYIEHGIPARVALQEGVPVFSFGNFTQIGKVLSHSDWFHTADASQYRQRFETLDDKAGRLAKAEEQLQMRLAGGIDAATSYMRLSAYASSTGPVPDVTGAVVVFLHDFYDSPHIFEDLLFPDFWSWACFTIDVLRESGIPFFVKPHPNQITLSNDALQHLVRQYPQLPLLPSTVSNQQLAQAGILCGVTVYGTVSHELAYLGVPTIGCARHPHHAYDFCRTAATIQDYAALLRRAAELPADKEEMRRQALEFYYMQNLYGSTDELSLRSTFVEFWKACNQTDPTPGAVVQRLHELRDCESLRSLAQKLVTPIG